MSMRQIINGQVVTDRETAPETAVRGADSGRAPESPETGGDARMSAYARVRIAGLGAVFKKLWAIALGDETSIWSAKPNTAAELVRYARDGAWCSESSRVWRLLGRIDAVLISIPATVALDIAQWLLQRPGRRLAAAFLIFILWLVIP